MPPRYRKAIAQELAGIHPDFAKSSSVVIHRFGTSPKHNEWRTNLLTPQGQMLEAFVDPFGDDIDVVKADDGPSQPTAPTPVTEPKPAEEPSIGPPAAELPRPQQPPRADNRSGFGNPPPIQPVPVDPLSQPRQQAVPQNLVFQQVPQVPTFGNPIGNAVVGAANTGIPLVDEALAEMRRLQQEARQDLSGSQNRGRVLLLRSQRNTSALFGAGEIDAVPDAVIEAAANQKYEDYPRVNGRVHRLPDNKIGKFGWKAQKATLRDFTLAACANELGLDVPEHPQPKVPYEAHGKSKGHDMTEKEADALVAYVRNLPAPIQETPQEERAAKMIAQGKELFESAGCAVCHKQDMGQAKGIYSDLLLHDMGDKLQASGSYGSSFTPQEFNPGDVPQAANTSGSPAQAQQPGQPVAEKKKMPPAVTPGEWRTPPLWGIRDSAPYLHDGRAMTMEQAIALHGGEGSDAAIHFFMLPAKKRQRVIGFLKTLRAPDQHAVAK